MSDAVKWAILVAAFIVLFGVIISLDVFNWVDLSVFNDGISTLINLAGDGFMFGRGLINNLLSPWARVALSGLMYWLIGRELILWTIKVSVWVYHYIFK